MHVDPKPVVDFVTHYQNVLHFGKNLLNFIHHLHIKIFIYYLLSCDLFLCNFVNGQILLKAFLSTKATTNRYETHNIAF